MHEERIVHELNDVMAQIEVSRDRLDLQPKLHQVILEMDRRRVAVPKRARRMEAALKDEAVEAMFDNVPV
ncbi:hypothetical protein AADZ90_008470 [Aestuariibius sp. 2305UL40-4]|uniref:hypothetical protein n=1 Tax=Aestuariibius violaceus TaxID=3234132 RepID=UPI00345ED345